MKKFILIFFLCSSSVVQAQSTNVFTLLHKAQKKADLFYDQMAWRNALVLYLRITEKDPADLHARQRIAECYDKLNDPASSKLWYTTLLEEPGVSSSVNYEYAEVLCENGEYEEAKRYYELYRQVVPDDSRTNDKLEFIRKLDYYLRDSILYRIKPLPINSSHADFGPQYFRDGLVFVSSRDRDLLIKRQSLASESEDEALLNIYYSRRDTLSKSLGAVTLFGSGSTRSIYHDGPISFYDHGRKAAFTRNNVARGKEAFDSLGRRNLNIFFADVEPSGKMKNIQPFIYNSDISSNAHASFSARGNILYFSSNRPQGMGGADIYFCKIENGQWSQPVNAGPSVNTEGDEFYPFMANDSTLYFTSNGHGGMGGLDIFICKQRKGKFRKAVNPGYPLNTSWDDFSLVTDSIGRTGYFASNRSGGVGLDDIYAFEADHYSIVGQTREFPNLSNIIPGATIYVHDENGTFLDSARSDLEGYFHFDLPLDDAFSFSAKKEGYDMLEDIGFSTKGRHFGIDSLAFPLWKRSLFAKGKIYSNETQEFIRGATVLLEDLSDNKIDSVLSENGEYSFLVRPNRKYRIEVHKGGFIPNGFNLNTKDLYKGDLLNDIVLEEMYIEKEVIQFDFNKYNVRPESFASLDHILRTLKKFRKATLNIGAYADARGTREYNQQLSDKRAEATVQYFLAKGISRERIISIGFGEELVLNQCSDGVECSEEQHSKNRRAELKVQHLRD